MRPAVVRALVLVLVLTLSGCAGEGTLGRRPAVPPLASVIGLAHRRLPVRPAQTPRMRRLVAVARARWALEQDGPPVHLLLRRLATDPALLGALRSRSPTRIRAVVDRRFGPVWYHWHVSRLRVVRGGRLITDVGVPFVVAASHLVVPGTGGTRLEVSDQDVIGFVRFMHRNHGVDVVARGLARAHVRTSLPAALRVRLPSGGAVTIAGRRYQVGSLVRHALGGERVRVWILARR